MPDPSTPETVGRYRVVRRMTTGATADVLLATETLNGAERPVVLKVMLEKYARDERFMEMFQRAASDYGRLAHPAIVQLYEVSSVDDRLVMALESVDGAPLSRVRGMLKAVGYDVDDTAAFHIAAEIFSALAAAHTTRDDTGTIRPVLHRYLSPSNVLIAWSGDIKLRDFGLPKPIEHQRTVGLAKGADGYMAPEQVVGDDVTASSDVYGAAILLWELLTKQRAFRRTKRKVEMWRAMAEPAIPSLDSLRPDLDSSVLDVLRRALNPDPVQRNVSASEVAAVFRKLVAVDEGRERIASLMGMVRHEPSPLLSDAPPPPPAMKLDLSGSSSSAAAASVAKAANSAKSNGANLTSVAKPKQSPSPSPQVLGATALAPIPLADPKPQHTSSGTRRIVPEAAPSSSAKMRAANPPPPLPPAAWRQMKSSADLVAAPVVALDEEPTEIVPKVPDSPLPDSPLPDSPKVAAAAAHVAEIEFVVPPPVRLPSLAVVAAVFVVLGGAGMFIGARAFRAPAPKPMPVVANATAPAPAASPTPSSAALPSPALAVSAPAVSAPTEEPATAPPKTANVTIPANKGLLKTTGLAVGRRIFVDDRTVGQTPKAVLVACGARKVKIGSSGHAQTIDVPCGDSITVDESPKR